MIMNILILILVGLSIAFMIDFLVKKGLNFFVVTSIFFFIGVLLLSLLPEAEWLYLLKFLAISSGLVLYFMLFVGYTLAELLYIFFKIQELKKTMRQIISDQALKEEAKE